MSLFLTSCSTTDSPNPDISSAFLLAKCVIQFLSFEGQFTLIHLIATSLSFF